MLLRIETLPSERDLHDLPNGVRLTGGDQEVVGLIGLEHQPYGLDVIGRVAPVPLRIEVAEVELVLEAGGDPGDRPGDLAGDEGLAAPRRLVVEEDSVDGEHVVRLAVVDGRPVRRNLR